MSISVRRLGVWVSTLVVGLAACDDPPANVTPAPAGSAPVLQEPSGQPAAATAATARPRTRRSPRTRGGARAVIRTALKDLKLDDEQKKKLNGAVDSLAPPKGADEGWVGFRKALAAGIRAGKLDDAAIATKVEEAKKAARARHERTANALNVLHATLSKEQRKQLLTSVRQAARGRKVHADWLDADQDSPGSQRQRGTLNVARLTRGLGLTKGQRMQVREAVTEGQGAQVRSARADELDKRRERMKAVLEAFETDTFDANKLMAEGDGLKRLGEDIDRQIEATRKVIPILTAEQRTKLADDLEKGTSARRRVRERPKR